MCIPLTQIYHTTLLEKINSKNEKSKNLLFFRQYQI